MSTGYFSDYGGAEQDLDTIFQAGSTGGDTGFKSEYQGGVDLAALFAPRASGLDIGFNTGFVALDGRDLREWFCKIGSPAPFAPGFNTSSLYVFNDFFLFNADGTGNGGNFSFWGSPPTPAAGVNYWVMHDCGSVLSPGSMAPNVWYQLDVQRFIALFIEGAGGGGTFYISTSPSGSPIVAQVPFFIQNE